MSEVLIDVTRLMDRFLKERLPTGVDRVSLAYLQHYGPRARAVLRYAGGKFVYRRSESATLFEWLLGLGQVGKPWQTIYKGLVMGSRAQRVAGSFLFNTGHTGLEQPEYASMLRQQRVRPLFMVHDLIPITHPEYCRPADRPKHLARMRNAMGLASGIVCNSQATLDALTTWCDKAGWHMPPAIAALLAPELPALADAEPGPRPVREPYFVFVSTIEPRKNHLMILQIWQRLVEKLGEHTPRLVIIGQRGWECDNVVAFLERCESIRGFVTELARCPDAEMLTYLQHAQALLFPSFTEGFGMPVIEALAHKVPVIAADLPVFREFAHGIPDYLDPMDALGWMRAIEAFAQPDSAQRLQQLARMQGFRPPTWAQHFAQVDALIERLEPRQTRPVTWAEPKHA